MRDSALKVLARANGTAVDDEEYLYALAEEIGFAMEEGIMPSKDENGFYILD